MEVELLDDRRGVSNSIVNYGLQLLWARRDRNRTERIHETLVLGSCYSLAHQAVELFNDLCRGALCRTDAHKRKRYQVYPQFLQCRDLRHGGKTRFPGRGENFDLLRIERLYCADRRGGIEGHSAGNKFFQCRGWPL